MREKYARDQRPAGRISNPATTEERVARGLTQEELAERVGIGPRQMQRVETGKVNVKLSLIFELSAALQTDPTSLFSRPKPSTARRVGRPRKPAG